MLKHIEGRRLWGNENKLWLKNPRATTEIRSSINDHLSCQVFYMYHVLFPLLCCTTGEITTFINNNVDWLLSSQTTTAKCHVIQTDVVHDGAVAAVADPLTSNTVQVPALSGEVTADSHSITHSSVHPSVDWWQRCRTTDYCSLNTHPACWPAILWINLKLCVFVCVFAINVDTVWLRTNTN